MARDVYQRRQAGATIRLWQDVEVDQYVKADFASKIADLKTLLDLPNDTKDIIRQYIFPSSGPDGQPRDFFDDVIEGEWQKYSDILDYFDYNTEPANITEYAFGWLTPQEVVDFPGEDVVDSHLLMIDEVNNTFWEYSTGTPPYSVTFKLRDYKKHVTGIRLRNTDGDLRSSLQNIQVKATASPGALDTSPNRFTTPVSMVSGPGTGGWQEFLFDNAARGARYIRLEGFDTEHSSDQVRIREIAVRCETRNYTDDDE